MKDLEFKNTFIMGILSGTVAGLIVYVVSATGKDLQSNILMIGVLSILTMIIIHTFFKPYPKYLQRHFEKTRKEFKVKKKK